MDRHSKICIIGAGMVGATSAFAIATHRIASELVIIDVNKEKAEGEAMDINHGLITMGSMNIHSGEYSDVKDSDIIVVAAGLGRKPGETRLDLAAKNIGIAKDIAQNIMKFYNGGVILRQRHRARFRALPLYAQREDGRGYTQHSRLYGG